MFVGGKKEGILHGMAKYGFLFAIILMIFLCYMPGAAAATASLTPVYRAPVYTFSQSLIMDLTTNVTSAYVNAPISVSAVAKYPNNTNVGPGYVITLTSTPSGGSFDVSSGTTGYTSHGILISGIYTNFKAYPAGTYTIKATVHDPNGNYLDGVANQTVTIKASPTFVMIVPISVTPTVTPVITPDTSQQTAPDNSQATSQQATPTVPASSVAAAAVTATATAVPAQSNTTALATGGNGLGGLGNLLPYIAGAIVIILLILLVFLYLWTKKTLKIVPKEAVAPCDGKTEIPVKVMFVNGFGSSRKPKSDVEVEMKATAGTIKNVVLPSSRDFVDASLIAPKEFGQATVSATANGKTATAPVSFTYKHASFDVSVTPDNIPSDGKSSANVKLQIKDENGSVIAPIVERNVDLKTTLGTIITSVKIPSKATEANATITAGDVSGTAVIYAVSGDIKGEGKVSFKGLPKRFCMHCGTRMDMDAASCPKCGLTPPSGVDTKACPTCNTVIPEAAKYCYNCGARQSEQAIKVDPTQQ